MITIQTKELRRFAALASSIKDTRILPIYGYVKLEAKDGKCTAYKSNGHSFVVVPINDAVCDTDESILIETVILFGYIDKTPGTYIEISTDGLKGLLDDKKCPTGFQSVPDNYPAIQPKEEGETWEFDEEVLSAISLARPHTLPMQDKGIREWNTFIHLSTVDKRYGIAGFNGFTFYFHTFKQKLPKMVFDLDTAAIITKFQSVKYSVSGNYQIFECGNVLYGFIMPVVTPMELSKFHENLSSGEYQFTVKRKDILDFCEGVINMNNTNLPPEVKIIGGADNRHVILKHIGAAGLNPEEPIEVEGKEKDFPEHTFAPKYLILALKGLSFENIKVSIIDLGFVFSSDEEPNYLGGAMKLSNLN